MQLKAYVALAVGAFAISTSAILVKWTDAPSAITAFYRLFFAVLFMTPFFIVKNISEIRTFQKRDWLFSFLSGTLLAFHFIFWFESLRYTSVASSVVLVTLQPLFAFIGAYLFFKEPITKSALLSVFLAIGGSLLISWGDFRVSGKALYGDLLALLACAMVTGYWLVGQNLRQRFSLIAYTYIVYGMAAAILCVYALLFQYSFLSYRPTDWLCFILLAIVPTLLGHSLFNWAMRWVSAAMVSMAILFEPIGAIILAYILLGETVQLSQTIGAFCIMVGVGIYLFAQHKKHSFIQKQVVSDSSNDEAMK
ncbi:DMT family transporter [Thermolongibacillus altinsuensis]